MNAKKTVKMILALLMSFVLAFSLIACDDDDIPEIDPGIHTDDQGTHLPIIDYVPPSQP